MKLYEIYEELREKKNISKNISIASTQIELRDGKIVIYMVITK